LPEGRGERAEVRGGLGELPLIGAEEPFEEALLLPQEDVAKRYTAEHARQIQWRRDAAIYMLAHGLPVHDIARICHMNTRLVSALATKEAQKYAAFSEDYAHGLLASAAGDIALADTKKQDADYKDLVQGARWKTQSALEVKLIGAGGDAVEAMDVVGEESPALKKFREELAKSRKQKAESGNEDGGETARLKPGLQRGEEQKAESGKEQK